MLKNHSDGISHPVLELNQTINIITKGGRTNSYYKCQLNKLSCQKINNPMILAADAARNAIFFLFLLDRNLPFLVPHLCIFVLFLLSIFDTILFQTQALHLRLLQRVWIYSWEINSKKPLTQSFLFDRRSKVKDLFFF